MSPKLVLEPASDHLSTILVQRKEGLPLELPPILITDQKEVSTVEELLSGERFFMAHAQSAKIHEIIQTNLLQNLLHSLPTVKSGYIFPLDHKFRTSVTVSHKEHTLKAFGGKGHEKALVECLAGAYKKIGSRSELVVEKSLLSTRSNNEIANFLGVSHIPHVEKNLHLLASIAFDDTQTSLEMFHKLRHLGDQPGGRELLIWWLGLNDKDKLAKIKKDLEVGERDDWFKKLIYFKDESIEEIALREFQEESGYTIQEGSFTPFLRFVEVKYDADGNRYLKDRLYALGEKGEKISEPNLSQSEKDQGIEAVFDLPIQEAIHISENALKIKFGFNDKGEKQKVNTSLLSKRSTTAANYLALKTLEVLINMKHIQGRKF